MFVPPKELSEPDCSPRLLGDKPSVSIAGDAIMAMDERHAAERAALGMDKGVDETEITRIVQLIITIHNGALGIAPERRDPLGRDCAAACGC